MRKQHNSGYKHKSNVKAYYLQASTYQTHTCGSGGGRSRWAVGVVLVLSVQASAVGPGGVGQRQMGGACWVVLQTGGPRYLFA